MLKTEQNDYANNFFVAKKADHENTADYEECLAKVDKSIYDDLSPKRDSSNHGYTTMTPTLNAESNQADNPVHRKKQSLLRQLIILLFCILIAVIVSAVVTFLATKHHLSELKDKQLCSIDPCENGGTCVNEICLCHDGFAGSKCEKDVNRTCLYDGNKIIPHPNKCQLYYNCSQAVSSLPTSDRYNLIVHRPAYLHECPYPELFSTTNMSCQSYEEVKCRSRYETKNQCDYLALGFVCRVACKVCIFFTPDCVGFADGIYRNKYRDPIAGEYFECRDERNIFNGRNPCPSNMEPYNGKCTDRLEIPPTNWHQGHAIQCSGRANGNYESENNRRCDIYYTCVNGITTLTRCEPGKVFNSKTLFCQNKTDVCVPCGSVYIGC